MSFCAPQATTRSRGNIHVELVDLQDLPDGYDCLGGASPDPQWQAATSRTMSLYADGSLVGSSSSPVADFTLPANLATSTAPVSYQLTYTGDTSAVLPVSIQTSTTWTFYSAPPAGLDQVRIPLLVVSYDLPLNLDNHPDGSTAVLSVAPVAGTPPVSVTGLTFWTSTDNGSTWQQAAVSSLGGGRYSAALPQVAAGQAVSLRVKATDAAGGRVEQTIIAAYHG